MLRYSFCHDKHTFVATNTILVAAPANYVNEGSMPAVEIPTLRQDDRGKIFFLPCIASELASEKNEGHVKFAECMFLNNCYGKNNVS